MKKMRKILLIGLLILPILLIGCGNKPKVNADESAKVLFNFFVKGDKSGLDKIEMPKETSDELAKLERKNTNAMTKEMFSSQGLPISEKQVNDIYDGSVEALKKVTVTTEEASKKEDSAQVKIKTTYINLKGIYEKAANDAVAEAKKLSIKDEKALKTKITEIYVKHLVQGLKNAKPSSDTKEKTFKFVNKDNVWVPENVDTFSMGIGDLALGAN